MLRVRGARDKCDCCDCCFVFFNVPRSCLLWCICYKEGKLDQGARCCLQTRVQHACLVMLFLSRACFDVIPVAKQRLGIKPPIVTAFYEAVAALASNQENMSVFDVNKALTT